MKTLWIIILTLCIPHRAISVVNVVVHVPGTANTFFPNNTSAQSKVDATSPTPEPTPVLASSYSAKAAQSKNYFQTLFDEVEVAKKTPPTISSVKLYDKLAEDSVALGILKEYPYLFVGSIAFRSSSRKAGQRPEIQSGQKLLLDILGKKQMNYKELAELIDQKMFDPNSLIMDKDWILMSNAFRTLKAPGNSNKAHLLGSLLSEYILLNVIKKQESKDKLTSSDDSFLSSLYYDLAQLYQSMYKNDENIFKDEKTGILSLPIDPIYRGDLSGEYRNDYPVPFSDLVGRRLDLLENAILFDPDDDLSWAQLIDFATFDLPDPEFYEQVSDEFWEDYFPFGFQLHHADELRQKWKHIHHHTNIRNNPHIRTNGTAGSRALRRLTNIHPLPRSLLNRTIIRPSHRPIATVSSAQTVPSPLVPPKMTSKPLPLSLNSSIHKGVKPAGTSYILDNGTSPYRVHEPNLSRYNTPRQTALPHHATTTRASSLGNVNRGSVPDNPDIISHEFFGGQSSTTPSGG